MQEIHLKQTVDDIMGGTSSQSTQVKAKRVESHFGLLTLLLFLFHHLEYSSCVSQRSSALIKGNSIIGP